MTEKTETEAIAALATKRAELIDDTFSNRRFLVTSGGSAVKEVRDLEGYVPGHVVQAVAVQDAPSLVVYVERFGTDHTVLFANIEQNRITAAIDYHTQSEAAGPHTDGTPLAEAPAIADHVRHRAVLQLAYAPEFTAWNGISGKMLSQEDFARFLDENRDDVTMPAAADLIEIVRELHAHRKATWGKIVRAGGVEHAEFIEDTTSGSGSKGDVPIPAEIVTTIPIYVGEERRNLRAFLRVAVEDNKLKVGIKIARLEMERQAAFREIAVRVFTDTGRPLIYGEIGAGYSPPD